MGSTSDSVDAKTLAAILNSSIALLILEVIGRVSLGEGALDTPAEEAKEYMRVPDIRLLDQNTRDLILKAFKSFVSRPIQSIFQEVKMKDRHKLDSLVLQALGLDPKQYLKPLYDSLTELVRERLELAGMRKTGKQAKSQRDVEKLKKQVLDEVLPYGINKFPDEFLEETLKPQDCENIPLPNEPLKMGMYFFGIMEVVSDSGFTYQAKSIEEAKYIIYSQKPDTYTVSLPKDKFIITKAVAEYEIYLRKLKNDIFQEFFKRTFDHKLSDTLMQRVLKEFNISDIIV